jgi:5-methylcytosine-specific restriction endonuclease McrBC GTP-binding regulatory subunit McrB
MYPQSFYENYQKNNMFFTQELLTRYCLSLYTKPFVILSGISGTGKTKIAQLFTTPDSEETTKAERVNFTTPQGEDSYILLNVTQGILDGDGRGNLKYSAVDAIYNSNELQEIEERIEELRESGDGGNICPPARIEILYNTQTVIGHAYLQRASSPLLRIRFLSKKGDAEQYDSRTFFRDNFNLGDKLKLLKTGDRRFQIVEVNDTAVIEEIEKFEQSEQAKVKNTCFVPVKSNWNDSSEVFGYYNLIEQKYHLTPILEFILAAKEYPKKPFFLILDEMNLSKVEHYFSDFLSCLESRHYRDGQLHQEPLHLHNAANFVSSNHAYFDAVPQSITLPENLYVTGTVNVDETTYMFSPKVLDRANVIEFNEVNLQIYREGNILDINDAYKLQSFPSFGTLTLPNRKHYIELSTPTQNFLIELNGILTPYNLHFGYRVVNEISLFITNAKAYISDEEAVVKKSLDFQIVQKVLPKLNGTISKLEEPVLKILEFLTDEPELSFESVQKLESNQFNYPLSIEKLKTMYLSLYRNGFASFIE